ncbi:MAG TPA: PKD domain-containing protein, partial [Chitinophagaceae bacterium]|nr:PKD domain-containing protein [Chitinophagaceae bacterium]
MALAQSPLANFTATPLSGCSPLVVDFQDLSSGNPTAWAWDFGNGSRSSVQNPSTTYFTSGRYTVTLTVTNESGKHTLTRTEYIEVYPKPTVDFSVDKRNGCFPVTTRFRDGSTGGAGSTPVSWLWDFGNGTQSTEQHPVNTYRGADNYTVVLKVTNDKGCSQVATKVNYVQVTEGVRAGFTFTQPKSCQLPLTTTFANTSTGVGTLTYSWSFGDGSTATTRNTNHTYTQPGAYPVQLVVASSLGCADTLRRDSLIHIPNVQVAAEIPDAVCAQTPVQFRSTSQPVPDSAYWSFGDGTLSGDSAPIKTFDRAGTYTIKSYNRYSFCIDSLVKNITVHALPVPAFTSTNNRSCRAPLTVSFRDVTPGATGWQWDFGDGQTSTEQHPRHTYNGEGVFPVRLIVTNANGCQDTVLVEDAVQILKPQVTLEATHVEG